VPVDCDRDDIGDWVALDRLLSRTTAVGRATVAGHHVGFEVTGTISYPEDAIVTVGVRDLVVKRGDAVLLVAMDRVADIKRVLEDDRLGPAWRPRRTPRRRPEASRSRTRSRKCHWRMRARC
jgi:hypothetical protein